MVPELVLAPANLARFARGPSCSLAKLAAPYNPMWFCDQVRNSPRKRDFDMPAIALATLSMLSQQGSTHRLSRRNKVSISWQTASKILPFFYLLLCLNHKQHFSVFLTAGRKEESEDKYKQPSGEGRVTRSRGGDL